jgi:hypothetical protein
VCRGLTSKPAGGWDVDLPHDAPRIGEPEVRVRVADVEEEKHDANANDHGLNDQ